MTRGDKLLIVFVLILTLISLGFIKKQGLSNEDKYVSIQVGGQEVERIIFDPAVVGKRIPIESQYGYNLVEIGDEEVRVIEASCPDKLDVKQGTISKIGESIVCLPNKMLIEIKGLSNNSHLDTINH